MRRKATVDAKSGIGKETKQGSRFEVLGNLEEHNVVNSESLNARLKDVVISGGPFTTARGKSVKEVGEGGDNFKVTSMVMANEVELHGNKNNPSEQDGRNLLIASKDIVISYATNLNAPNHRAVRVIKNGLENEDRELNKRSFIGPICNSGSKGAHRAKTNIRHVYKKGTQVVKKDVRKRLDKLLLEDWPSLSPNEDSMTDKLNVIGDDAYGHNKSDVGTMVQENIGVGQTGESGSDQV
ncbi:hypothetical protein V6N11_067779 [Hibiscus sabdariffa]